MRLPAWLAPNRIAVYVGALVTILTGLAALLSAIDTPEAIALAASVLALVGLLNRFLIGWQKWEAAVVAPATRAQASAIVVDPASTPGLSFAFDTPTRLTRPSSTRRARARTDVRQGVRGSGAWTR